MITNTHSLKQVANFTLGLTLYLKKDTLMFYLQVFFFFHLYFWYWQVTTLCAQVYFWSMFKDHSWAVLRESEVPGIEPGSAMYKTMVLTLFYLPRPTGSFKRILNGTTKRFLRNLFSVLQINTVYSKHHETRLKRFLPKCLDL